MPKRKLEDIPEIIEEISHEIDEKTDEIVEILSESTLKEVIYEIILVAKNYLVVKDEKDNGISVPCVEAMQKYKIGDYIKL